MSEKVESGMLSHPAWGLKFLPTAYAAVSAMIGSQSVLLGKSVYAIIFVFAIALFKLIDTVHTHPRPHVDASRKREKGRIPPHENTPTPTSTPHQPTSLHKKHCTAKAIGLAQHG